MVGVEQIKEVVVLEQFRCLVQDLGQDDETLTRFLRARNHDLRKAEEMLRKSVEWRKTLDIDSCLTWEIPVTIQEEFPRSFPGLDYEGRAVVYLPTGNWEIRKMIEKGWKEDMIRNIYFVLEDIMKQVKQTKQGQFTIIVDLAGMTYWKVAHYETIQMILQVFRAFEANYPERLREAFVINAPWVFGYIWPFIKPLLSGNTLTKVKVFDSNQNKWKPAMLGSMSENTLSAAGCCDKA